MNCPIVVEARELITPDGDEFVLYECPFGDHALHLGDHRCTKLSKRKEAVELLQNGGE